MNPEINDKFPQFKIILFIIIIYIVIMSGNIMSVVIVCSLAANYYFLCCNDAKIDFTKPITDIIGAPEVIDGPVIDDPTFNIAPDDLYGREYLRAQAYNDVGNLNVNYKPIINEGNSIDNIAMILAQRRNRDKQSMDSRAIKDKNFYKQYYDESEFEQQAPWWGVNQY